jgi:ATP/maltotriose-dependent transcriptional regulator MalT
MPLLTPRGLEVVALAARGLSAQRIAEHLVISTMTVRTHFENLYPKLQVSDRAAAVRPRCGSASSSRAPPA